MRSYRYDRGQWTMIESPLKENQSLEEHGFDSQHRVSLVFSGLALFIHARDPRHLPAQRTPQEFPYDFCCVIGIYLIQYYVWVTDLPSLIQFLQEVKPEEENIFPGQDESS